VTALREAGLLALIGQSHRRSQRANRKQATAHADADHA
jgi:hypothetical protein